MVENVAVAEIVRYMPLIIETVNVELVANVRRIDKDLTRETVGAIVAERER